MAEDPATQLKERIRVDLMDAIRAKRRDQAAVLRSLLAAIDNAEAPALDVRPGTGGPTEIERLILTPDQLQAVLLEEILGREKAARELAGLGQQQRADVLLDQAAIARRYLTAHPAQGTGASPA